MKIVSVILVCFFIPAGVTGSRQDRVDDRVHIIGPAQCQDYGPVLDVLAQNTPSDSLIIVIARRSVNETRPNINHRRLHNVRTYLTEFHPDKRRADTLVLAEGAMVKEPGQLELYVDGRLVAIIKVKRNADLIVGNCYPEPMEAPLCSVKENRNFYPCLDRKTKQKKS